MENILWILSIAYIAVLLTAIVLYVRKEERNIKLFEAKINVLREIIKNKDVSRKYFGFEVLNSLEDKYKSANELAILQELKWSFYKL